MGKTHNHNSILPCGILLLALLSLASPRPARAGTVLFELFDTDTSDTAQTVSAYPGWSTLGTSPVKVVNGAVEIIPQGSLALQGFLLSEGFAGDLLIETGLGRSNGSGGFNVGFKIGDNNIVFHPGYPNGAFRVEGPGGFGNTNMGFTPAAGVFHPVEIAVIAATGEFTVTVTDGNNPGNIFTRSFINPGYNEGDPLGLTTHGYLNEGISRMDNLSVISSVPLPSALLLFPSGLLMGWFAQRGKKR